MDLRVSGSDARITSNRDEEQLLDIDGNCDPGYDRGVELDRRRNNQCVGQRQDIEIVA